MSKAGKLTISISSDPRFTQRYFVDFRDVTNGRNKQLRVWHKDAAEVIDLAAQLEIVAKASGVALEIVDESGEISFL